MKGTTFRVSHPHWRSALAEEGGGRVVLIGSGGRPHMVLSSQVRAELLVGKLAEWHRAQPGGRASDQNAWSKGQSFGDFARIEAVSERMYGRDGVLYERQENAAKAERDQAQLESDADRRARTASAAKRKQDEDDAAALERAEQIRRRQLEAEASSRPPAE